MSARLRVVILEDQPPDAELMVDALRQAGLEPEWKRVDRKNDFLKALEEKPDIVLADYNVPGFGAVDALEALHKNGIGVPVIVISGSIGDELAAECIRRGADDFLLKDRLARLGAAVKQALERKHAKEWLRKLSHAVEQSPAATLITDTEGLMEWVNPKFIELSGFAMEELIGKTPRVVKSGLTPIEVYQDLWRTIKSGAEWRGEIQNRKKNGELYWEYEIISPLKNERGEIVNFIAVKEDITERKHAIEQLQASETRFQQLAENIREVFFLTDPANTQILYISPMYEEIWGRSCKSLYAEPKSWMDSIHPEDLENVRKHNKEMEETGRMDYEYRIIRPDAGIRWIRARGFPILNDVGKVYRVAGIADDITGRKQAEEKIRRLNRIYSVLSEINSAIVRIHARQPLFEEACRIAVEHGRFHMAWLGLVDAGALKITPAAWAGDTEGFFDAARFLMNKAGKDKRGLTWNAYYGKRPVTSNDVQNDRRVLLLEYFKKRGIRSAGIFPLMQDNEVIGTLGFYSKEPDVFDEEEIRLLTELAGDISFALQSIAKEEKLNYLAYYDALTGLPNRTLFLDRLAQALHAAAKAQRRVAVFVGDVQHLRQINETFGRQAGDALLRELAGRLKSFSPDPGNVSRIEADSFAGIIPDIVEITDIARQIESLIPQMLAKPFTVGDTELSIVLITGIAVYPNDGEDADALLRNAEAALKKAKLTGERYLFYQPEMTARVAETLLLENKLRKAIELDQFVLHYQPKVHVETHKVTGLEALIRWNDPESGLVPPGKFIPILEETGMILEVGVWAIGRVFADARRWRAEGIEPPRIAVNVSQVQMQKKDFVAVVKRAVEERGSEPLMLDLEITETMLMRNINENIEKLSALRKMGINIAIDDFGTGYSSLGYLARLPVNALKIDRSFIAGMTSSPENMTIVSTVISLAHAMNLKVIAEGVETDEQSRFLRLLKCDELQGFLFSKPLPPDKVIDWLRVK